MLHNNLIDDLMFETEEDAQKLLNEKYPGHIVHVNDKNVVYVFNQQGQPIVKISPSGQTIVYGFK